MSAIEKLRTRQIVEAVRIMRNYQKLYFKNTRSVLMLENAKDAEQVVDRLIEDYDQPTLTEGE